jgi:acylphosphatase
MKARAHVLVSGRVQGVFFRSETRREARKRGVTGWVRNLLDGRVEAVFEGEELDVKAVIEFCKRGPPDALIKNAEAQWEDYKGEFREFEMRC